MFHWCGPRNGSNPESTPRRKQIRCELHFGLADQEGLESSQNSIQILFRCQTKLKRNPSTIHDSGQMLARFWPDSDSGTIDADSECRNGGVGPGRLLFRKWISTKGGIGPGCVFSSVSPRPPLSQGLSQGHQLSLTRPPSQGYLVNFSDEYD